MNVIDHVIVSGVAQGAGGDMADQLVGILGTLGLLQHGEHLIVLDTVTHIEQTDGGDGIQLTVGRTGVDQDTVAGACLGDGVTHLVGIVARGIVVGNVPVEEARHIIEIIGPEHGTSLGAVVEQEDVLVGACVLGLTGHVAPALAAGFHKALHAIRKFTKGGVDGGRLDVLGTGRSLQISGGIAEQVGHPDIDAALGQVLNGITLAIDGVIVVPRGEGGGLIHAVEIEGLEINVALERNQQTVILPAPDVLQLVGLPGDGQDAEETRIVIDILGGAVRPGDGTPATGNAGLVLSVVEHLSGKDGIALDRIKLILGQHADGGDAGVLEPVSTHYVEVGDATCQGDALLQEILGHGLGDLHVAIAVTVGILVVLLIVDADDVPEAEGGVHGGLVGEGHVVDVGIDVGHFDALACVGIQDLNGGLVGTGSGVLGGLGLYHEATDGIAEGVFLMVPVGAREGADEDVGAIIDLTVGIHTVTAAFGVTGIGDVGIIGDDGIGIDKGGWEAVMGDVTVLHVELHTQLGGEGLALVIGKIRNLDVDFLIGGGVKEELASLNLIFTHLDGIAFKAVLHARKIVTGDLFGDMVEPELDGGIVIGGDHGLLVGDGIIGRHIHIGAVAQLVLFLQGVGRQVGGHSADVDGQLAEAVDGACGGVLDKEMHLFPALEAVQVEEIAVACGVGIALLLSGLEDGCLAGHGGGIFGGVGLVAVGADAPAQLEAVKAKADPTVQLEHTGILTDSHAPVARLIDVLGILGQLDFVLDGIKARLPHGLIGISPIDVPAVTVDVGRGGFRLGLRLGFGLSGSLGGDIRGRGGGFFGGILTIHSHFIRSGIGRRRGIGGGLRTVHGDIGNSLGRRGRLRGLGLGRILPRAGHEDQEQHAKHGQNYGQILFHGYLRELFLSNNDTINGL